MAHVLHLDSSPRDERSQSRRMTKEFIEQWQQSHPRDTVTYRDIGRQPIPHIDELWIAAAFTSPEHHTPEMRAAICLSDQLVDEFLAADVYVIGVPMYNFSVPSGFKAYIDQIVRVGRTFEFVPDDAENSYKPLVLGKKMFIITARGASGYGVGERYGAQNYQDPYLRSIFGFLGITDITFIAVENEESGEQLLAHSIAQARRNIRELLADLAKEFAHNS